MGSQRVRTTRYVHDEYNDYAATRSLLLFRHPGEFSGVVSINILLGVRNNGFAGYLSLSNGVLKILY